jgi:uncharacterized protein YkwD
VPHAAPQPLAAARHGRTPYGSLRTAAVLVALAVVAVLVPPTEASAAEPADSPTAEAMEWQLLDLINADRTAAGLRPLAMQTHLRDYARHHARDQRTQGRIWHDMEEYETWVPAGWRSIGENVAYHGSVTAMHQAYMDSPGHRANILGAGFTHIGIGIMVSGSRIYNSEDFMQHPSTTLPLATRPGTPPPADTTPPTVTLTAPGAGTVRGTVPLAATARDAVGVTKVEFRVDGVVRGTDTTAPYAYSWDSGTAANGRHTLTARAYDAAGGGTTSAGVAVTVQNPLAPTRLRAAAGTAGVALRWDASAGATGYRVYAGSTLLGTTRGTRAAHTTAGRGAPTTYSVRAQDAAGGTSAASAPLTVTVP